MQAQLLLQELNLCGHRALGCSLKGTCRRGRAPGDTAKTHPQAASPAWEGHGVPGTTHAEEKERKCSASMGLANYTFSG